MSDHRPRPCASPVVPLLAALLLGPAAPALSAGAPLPPIVGATELYARQPWSGVALGGFDPVTYFLPGGPEPGSADHELVRDGVVWRFVSEANRAAFERDVGVYRPRIGGFDPAGAARGLLVDADPRIYLVERDRLYLFRNDGSRARFLADRALVTQAEANWPRLRQDILVP